MNTKNTIEIRKYGTIHAGDYGDVFIHGAGSIDGDITFETLEIDGHCSAEKKLNGKLIQVNGYLEPEDDIKVNELVVNGVVESDDIKIYGEQIHIHGILKNRKEVNGEYIIIHGRISFHDLVGEHIEIHGRFRDKDLGVGFNQADDIACTTLVAERLKVKHICASNITLTRNCIIDSIQCDGILRYDSTCQIDHIEGDCDIIKD